MLILGVLLVIFIGLDAQHGGLMLLILRGLAGHLEGSCCSSGGPCCSSWSSCCSSWRSCCWAWRVMFFILELLLLSFGKHFSYLGVLLERLGGGLGEVWGRWVWEAVCSDSWGFGRWVWEKVWGGLGGWSWRPYVAIPGFGGRLGGGLGAVCSDSWVWRRWSGRWVWGDRM